MMRRLATRLWLLFVLPLAACASAQRLGGSTLALVATVRDSSGRELGIARLERLGQGGRLTLRLSGLPPGAHAMHLHEVGRCDLPDFASAGGHWNPERRAHGLANRRGPHRGDLPTVVADAGGRVEQTLDLPWLSMSGVGMLLDGDGTSLLLHERTDDLMSDPAGNSGARIACGTLQR